MNQFSKITLILFTAAVIFFSCRKPPEFPIEPEITFKDFVVTGDSATITISFTDGDGDIGLRDSDTTGNFSSDKKTHYNLYLEYLEQEGGTFVQRSLFVPFYYRVPYITQESKNKALEGDISVVISPSYYATNALDSFKYSIQLVDRELHESNIVETPILIKPN